MTESVVFYLSGRIDAFTGMPHSIVGYRLHIQWQSGGSQDRPEILISIGFSLDH